MSRLFLPDGTLHTTEPWLPEDQPYAVNHDKAAGETVLLIRQRPAPGRTSVVPQKYVGAKQLFTAAADFERSSVQLGRVAAAMQNILITAYGLPEDELERALDSVLADLHGNDLRHEATERAGDAPPRHAEASVAGDRHAESRIALLMKVCLSLRNDLDAGARTELAATVARLLGCGRLPPDDTTSADV